MINISRITPFFSSLLFIPNAFYCHCYTITLLIIIICDNYYLKSIGRIESVQVMNCNDLISIVRVIDDKIKTKANSPTNECKLCLYFTHKSNAKREGEIVYLGLHVEFND